MTRDFHKDRQKIRAIENGSESAIDGTITPGLGKDESPVFGPKVVPPKSETVVVRRPRPSKVPQNIGRRIDPKSELGQRIAANALAGSPEIIPSPAKPASPLEKSAMPSARKPQTQKVDSSQNQASRANSPMTPQEFKAYKKKLARLLKAKERTPSKERIQEIDLVSEGKKKQSKKAMSPQKKEILRKTIEMIFGKRD